jgi:hypothetical protein
LSSDGHIAVEAGTSNAAFIDFRINGTNKHYVGSASLLGSGTNDSMTVWNSANGYMNFGTNGTERARIDSSGRLLVGTSSSRSPAIWTSPLLQIEGTSYTSSSLSIVNNQNTDAEPGLTLGKSRGTTVGSNTAVASGDILGTINFQGADGSSLIRAAQVFCAVDGTPGSNDMPGRLVFCTTADGASSPSEAMRITSSQEVLIGGTVDIGPYALQVKSTGVWGAGAYVNGSDRSIKEYIEPLTSSIEIVKQLNPVSFRYKEDFSKDTTLQPGFVAQDLQQAFAGQPYLDGIVQAGPEFLSVAYQSLIPILTKALQEAVTKIETLEAKVAVLEAS